MLSRKQLITKSKIKEKSDSMIIIDDISLAFVNYKLGNHFCFEQYIVDYLYNKRIEIELKESLDI